MVFDRPIIIQKINEDTEVWENYLMLHCRLNKAGYNESSNAGATRSSAKLTFEVRYCPAIEDIFLNTQFFRIVYKNNNYNILDYDDFMFKHKTVKLIGESY